MFQKLRYPKLRNIMKNFFISLVFVLGFSLSAIAQPVMTLNDVTVNNGNAGCITVTIGSFAPLGIPNIFSIENVMFQWNPANFTNINIQNINPAVLGLDPGDFTINQGLGTMMMDWVYLECSLENDNGPGVTFPNINSAMPVFDICFDSATGDYGSCAPIEVVNPPNNPPVVHRAFTFNVGCPNIGMVINEPGCVFFDVSPLQIVASQESGNTGDLVCVDFSVSNFIDMQSAQFDIIWDPAVLSCVNQIPGDIPNLSSSNFNCLPGGRFRVSWASLPDQGVTVDDETLFFTACFDILAPCESFTSLDIDLNALVEITNTTSPEDGFPLPYQYSAGSVTTGDCDPIGLQLFANCGDPVNINDNFCVEVTVGDNFFAITDMSFLMEWNEQILTFTGVQNLNSNVVNLNNAISANIENGFLSVDWQGPPPATIPNGGGLFDVCFTVTGLGGNSPFTFIQSPSNVQSMNGPNIGINPSNCQVQVIQPEGVAMSLGSGSATFGEEFCVDIAVSNFDSITSYQYSLNWDPALFDYISSNVMNFPGATNANITAAPAGGLLFFDFNGNTPITLDDGTVIMQICFAPLGTPGTCSPLEMITVPLAPEAISASSNGENIGILDTPGDLCTLFPEGFGIYIDTISGLWLDTACVTVSVESFDNITDASLRINWDPTMLGFVEVNDFGTWPGLVLNTAASMSGLIGIDWSMPGALAIPDGTDVFEMCFELIGDAPVCTPVSISSFPAPIISTSNGMGSLVYEDGEVCIEDRYILTDLVIVPTTCPGECDGEITFSVIGGTEPLGTTWNQNGQQQFMPFHATNLCAGDTVYVTVFDNSQPILFETFTFVVPLDTLNVPTADAGNDATINCNTGLALLQGTASPGANVYWTDLSNGNTLPGNTYFADHPGFFKFTAENPISGCSAMDTAQVFPGVYPIAQAGNNISYTCLSDTIMLNGTGSAAGDTISYSWSVLEGGDIVTGDENLLMPQVTGPGLYLISVENEINQCAATDTVRVEDDRLLPEAIINNGAETITLTCDAAVILNAATQNNEPVIVEYEWFDSANNVLSTNPNFAVSDLGTYYLVAFNSLTSCTASDTIQVVPNEDFPVITTIPAADTSLTCLVDTIQIIAEVDGNPVNYIYTWATPDGQFVSGTDTTLMPIIVAAGVYTLEVMDTSTHCTAIAQITVALDTIAPVADAGLDLVLTCAVESDTLQGPNTSLGGNMAYAWTDSNGMILSTESFLVVDAEGTYCLEVINTESGCSSSDCAEVILNAELPVVTSANFTQNITCENDTLTLQPDMITSPNGDYDVLWSGDPFIGDDTLEFIMVDMAGVYQIQVTDPVTGCVGIGDFVIGMDTISPVADAGTGPLFLNCVTSVVTLGSNNSSSGPEFTYLWANTTAGETPTPDNSPMTNVMTAGTYQLTVMNTSNGCSTADEIEVAEDFEAPVVTIADPELLTCIQECVDLTASVDGLTDITVTWLGLDGGVVNPADALITSVCEAGSFSVSVTNNLNGCMGSDTILVEADLAVPVIAFEVPSLITCADVASLLDASGTGAAGDYSTIEWTGPGNITPPNGNLMVEVDEPGDYELHVIFLSNGCEATGVVAVDSDTELPVADAGEDFILECGEVGAADGSGSSQGPAIEYNWTALTGTIVGDPTGISPMVEGAGTYVIDVTNSDNGCASADTVMITFEFPPDAVTMIDSLHCGDSITISANLPAGTTGVWTSLGAATVNNPASATSLATPLFAGDNLFVWTLSADGCDAYSSDTLIISSESAPIANNDLIELTEEIRFGSTNIIANDITSGAVTITILSEPAFGQMDSLHNGTYSYSVGPGASGETEVVYQICSTSCPDKCDEATIIIIVPEDPNQPEIPNTITPNEDGLNDFLIFDIIANNPPDEFPDNEIIIFNRWGDIVYQAAPYNNDWNGLNAEGKELPHGTYYYILRLNISKGEIIRGDVTIIK